MQEHEHNAAARPGSAVAPMGSLLAEMNHDIRTSMNGVRGMLDLLLDTGLSPSQQEYARTAQHSVDSLMESLERIVDLSLIESNNFRLNQAAFDLDQEVRAALAGKPASAQDKGLELSIVYPPSLRLYGDPARLREAFSALCDAALQCAAGETMSLSVDATCLPGGLCRVTLEAVIPNSSEESASLARMMDGAGGVPGGMRSRDFLGMALCTELVRMMNGSLTIDRAQPPATVFRLCVDLPLAPHAFASARALILASQPAEWQAKLATLTRLGMLVESFDSAAAGLAAVDAAARAGRGYRLVLIERGLEGLDPGVLCSAIQSSPVHRTAVFVLLDDAGNEIASAGPEFSASLRASDGTAESDAVLIPLCFTDGGGPASASAHKAAPTGATASLSHAGSSVLVADDNPVNQQVAARMLEKFGCKASVVADGIQAIEMHTWKRFDLILMDCEMPVLDGLEATQRIRASEGDSRRTPIIALTAATGQGEQERCLAAGMDDFLSKPIRPQLLGEVLARWLPRPGPATETPAVFEDELDEVKEMFGADFAELAALYQNDGAPRLALLREAAAAGDCAKVAKVAHAFGGSCASIGATGLSALSKTLETAAKAGSLDDFDRRMNAIENEYRRVCGKLQSLLKP